MRATILHIFSFIEIRIKWYVNVIRGSIKQRANALSATAALQMCEINNRGDRSLEIGQIDNYLFIQASWHVVLNTRQD